MNGLACGYVAQVNEKEKDDQPKKIACITVGAHFCAFDDFIYSMGEGLTRRIHARNDLGLQVSSVLAHVERTCSTLARKTYNDSHPKTFAKHALKEARNEYNNTTYAFVGN